MLKKSADALQRPVWAVFLGRKSCPATRPVFEAMTQEYDSLLDALLRVPAAKRNDGQRLLCEIEDDNGTINRRDVKTALPGQPCPRVWPS